MLLDAARTAVCLSLILCTPPSECAADASGQTPDVPIILSPGQPIAQQVTDKTGARYLLALPSGQASEFRLTQITGAVDITFDDGVAEPIMIRTEAGRRGRVQTMLLAKGVSRWLLSVTPRRTSATFDIDLTIAHRITDADRRSLEAFRLYAAAELLRRTNYRETVIKERSTDVDARTRGAYESATHEYQLLGDGCGLRRARIGLARMEVAIGNYTQARLLIDQAMLANCQDDLAEQAQALKTRGMATAYQGDFAESASAAEQALALYQQTGDKLYQGVVLGNLSSVYTELGATDRALEAAQGALMAAEASGDAQGVVYGRKSIAAIQLARGELAAALGSYRQTLVELQKTPYPMIEGETWNDLGILYHRMADYDESLRAYARAQDVWAHMKNRVGIADTTLNQAEALLDNGSRAAAARAFAEALAIAQADGLKSAQVRALRGQGAERMLARDWPAARRQFEASRDLAQQISELAAQSYAIRALGDLAYRRGDALLARANYQQALQLVREAADRDGEAATLAQLARTTADAGDPDDALQMIRAALAIVEEQRGQISDPSLRTSYFASFHGYHDIHVDILMELERRQPGHGYAVAALVAAEQARARSLQEMLAERSIDIERNVDPALAAALRAAEERLSTAAFQSARLPRSASIEQRQSARATVDATSRALDEVRGRVRSATPRYAELAYSRPLSLNELQQQLIDADSVVLEYWLGERHSYLWTVSRHTFRVQRLPRRAVIERQADALLAVLRRHALADSDGGIEQLIARDAQAAQVLASESAKLGKVVIADALNGLRQRHVAVIADGNLQRLPFSVLRAGGANDDLGARRDFVYLPSIATLRWLRAPANTARHTMRLAVLADPVFRIDAAPERGGGTREAAEIDIRSLARLPNSRREAQSIAALLPKEQSWLAMDYAASRDTVLTTDWRQFSIVHFAAHSIVDLRQPELSGIVLSLYDRDGKSQDGFLRINDIYNLDMPADLVVLSACESGIGKTLRSEGSFSLARAFFYAGAPRVIASLWAVDDRATAKFMVLFYRALLVQGKSASAALRAAQQAMARDPRWHAAYYWAGFVLQGDWR